MLMSDGKPPDARTALSLSSHCDCVFEKNYRLQDIQLSKSRSELRTRGPKSKPGRGGEYRARTGDLLVANQALSQLS